MYILKIKAFRKLRYIADTYNRYIPDFRRYHSISLVTGWLHIAGHQRPKGYCRYDKILDYWDPWFDNMEIHVFFLENGRQNHQKVLKYLGLWDVKAKPPSQANGLHRTSIYTIQVLSSHHVRIIFTEIRNCTPQRIIPLMLVLRVKSRLKLHDFFKTGHGINGLVSPD